MPYKSIIILIRGGINYENVEMLKGTHIDGVAAVSAIFSKKDIETETKRLKERVISIIEK